MAATSYEYDVLDDFSGGVDNAALQEQVEQSAISSAVVMCIDTLWKGAPVREKCDVWFDDPLSPGDKVVLDSVVAAHDGKPLTVVKFHASSVLTDHEREVTSTDPTWIEVGGTVTTPSFFSKNLLACRGRIVGMCRANGEGAKLRLCEDVSPSDSFSIPDTAGAWVEMQWFSSTAPTEGIHEYRLEGQLPTEGATEAAVKYVAVSLLEFC
jgi:hypothetical protein